MRAVVQRVADCSVRVDDRETGRISSGLLVYLGIADGDGDAEIDYVANKVAFLRIFEDSDGKMNLSTVDAGGDFLVVSQFTLYGDVRKGRRPSYDRAARPSEARSIYEKFVVRLRDLSGRRVETGEFQAKMEVGYTNMGPVTILIDTEQSQKKF